MGHIRLYSFNEVKRFLEYTGFEIEYHVVKGETKCSWKRRVIGTILRLIYSKEHFYAHLYVVARKKANSDM